MKSAGRQENRRLRKWMSSPRWASHRIAAAFFVAPIIPCNAVIVLTTPGPMPDWGLYNTILLVAVFLCWVVSGLFAFPAFVILRRRGQVNFWTSVGSGAAVGGILALLFSAVFLLGQRTGNPSAQARTVLQAVILGSSIGFFFWLIGVWRNPAFMKQSDQHPEDIFT